MVDRRFVYRLIACIICFVCALGGCIFYSYKNKTVVLENSNRMLYYDSINDLLYEKDDKKDLVIYSKDSYNARWEVMHQYHGEHGGGVCTMTGIGYRLGNGLIYYYIVSTESGYSIYEIISEDNDTMAQLRHGIETIAVEEGHMLATMGEEKCRMLSDLCFALYKNGVQDYQKVLEMIGFSNAEFDHARVIFEAIKECSDIVAQYSDVEWN